MLTWLHVEVEKFGRLAEISSMTYVKRVTSLICSIAIGLILFLDISWQRYATFSLHWYPSYAKMQACLHGKDEELDRLAEISSMTRVKLVTSLISSIAIGLILFLDIFGQR